ncbi:hypothetical protein [Ferroacidibacillus organovorans]|uniref:hypothetical protein n=1 Tax=Ferroacidibacillus organovorans TaxID=1765683 RepID=UPI00128FB8A6|nr:hypothetical protein [Ferroacidibacillus organovorans]
MAWRKGGWGFGVNQAASTGDVASLFVAALKKAGQLTLPKGVTPLTYATQLGIFRGFNPVHGTRVTRAGAAVILENILSYANGTLLPSGETPVLTASATNVSPNSVVQLSLALRSANGQTQAIPANANVTYALDNQTGAVLDTYSGTLIVTQPGTYTVTATVDGVSVAPLIITAYAQPAGINLSSSSSTLTANGQALDTMTATIVDSTGQTVSNASGTASLSALQYGSYVDPTTGAPISSIHFVNGVATFAVKAGTTGGVSDTVSLSNVALSGTALASTFVDPSTTISYTWPSANALTLSPTTATVSDNQATEDAVSATVGGLGTSVAGLPVLAQFTLSGPASFQAGGSLLQTFSAYVVPGVPTQIPVWSLPGQSGAITLDASLSGAVVASTTISAVATGAPTALVVSSTPSTVNAMGAAQEPALPQGSPFTLYTVSLSDAAGHAVIPATSDPLTLTDNASTVGGTLAYYAVANGQPTGPALSASQLQTAISASTGLAQFAVVTTGAGAVSPQITLHDALTGTEKTVGYAYSSGVGVYAMLTGDTPSDLNGASSSVEEGQTVTYTAQLEDPNGNPVQAAGQTIDFYFAPRGNSADVTVNGSSAWSQAAPLAVTTNAQGVASVSVTVPQGKGGEFQLVAGLPGQTSVSEVTATVGSTLYYTTGLALSSSPYALNGMVWPTAAMPLGQTLAGYAWRRGGKLGWRLVRRRDALRGAAQQCGERGAQSRSA